MRVCVCVVALPKASYMADTSFSNVPLPLGAFFQSSARLVKKHVACRERRELRGPWLLAVGSGTIKVVAELSLALQCV